MVPAALRISNTAFYIYFVSLLVQTAIISLNSVN
jgi:hypothetical protein